MRRAAALQRTPEAEDSAVRMNSAELSKLGLNEASQLELRQGMHTASVEVVVDETVPAGCLYLPAATEASAQLGTAFGHIEVKAS